MSKPGMNEERPECAAGYAHLSIFLGSNEKMDERVRIFKIFKNDGYAMISEPRITGDGYYESMISDPEGNLIELSI